jgi:hypothetical protein
VFNVNVLISLTVSHRTDIQKFQKQIQQLQQQQQQQRSIVEANDIVSRRRIEELEQSLQTANQRIAEFSTKSAAAAAATDDEKPPLSPSAQPQQQPPNVDQQNSVLLQNRITELEKTIADLHKVI